MGRERRAGMGRLTVIKARRPRSVNLRVDRGSSEEQ
jgi:hypothetical protein